MRRLRARIGELERSRGVGAPRDAGRARRRRRAAVAARRHPRAGRGRACDASCRCRLLPCGRPTPSRCDAGQGGDGSGRRGRTPGADAAALDGVLALPHAHLVVDGYNVTKTGYGDLPLEQQRTRLIASLAPLAAQSGAEITIALDGGARPPAQPAAPRGVRVLFSAADEIADDLIRRLVAAEPAGRVVVVVTSDGEVVRDVRRGRRLVGALGGAPPAARLSPAAAVRPGRRKVSDPVRSVRHGDPRSDHADRLSRPASPATSPAATASSTSCSRRRRSRSRSTTPSASRCAAWPRPGSSRRSGWSRRSTTGRQDARSPESPCLARARPRPAPTTSCRVSQDCGTRAVDGYTH